MDDLVAKALGLFSGPDYLSTGKESSFANMPTQDETNADFFKADRAARLAREIEAGRDVPLPPRRPMPVSAEAVEAAPKLPRASISVKQEEPSVGFTAPIQPYRFGPTYYVDPLPHIDSIPTPTYTLREALSKPQEIPSDVVALMPDKLTDRAVDDPATVRADDVWGRMIKQESGGRQFDKYGRTITSPAGALGISQVMPTTGPEAARLAGLPWDVNRLKNDPEYNHALGRAYYDAQLARFGDPVLAAAAYNGGPGRVQQALAFARQTGRPWTDFLKPETQNYVRVVGRAEGGLVDDALHVVREHHADGEAVGQGAETNALGMTPDQFAEYAQTKAPPAPGFVESALRNVREYAMPRAEDYTHAMDQSAATADYLTKSGKEGMLSGNPWEMAKGAGMSMLGTALPVIAPVGAALEAGVVNPAERVLGPAGRQAAEVATMVPGEGVGAALKLVAKYAPEISPVAAAMSMIPKAVETTAPVRELSPLGFYSHGAETAAGLPQAKGTPEQYAAMLQKAGVKPAEMEVFGEAFAGRPSVTRDEVAAHFKERMPQVEEQVLGLGNGDTKFGQYTLPGGENYREVLLKLPPEMRHVSLDEVNAQRQKISAMLPSLTQAEYDAMLASGDIAKIEANPSAGKFKSSHWDDPNVLAHLRLADRTGPNGEKVLHVEELQSDWGQQGRDRGFAGKAADLPNNLQLRAVETEPGIWEVRDGQGNLETARNFTNVDDANAFANQRNNALAQEGRVPAAPYVTNTQAWTDLALKRALKEAAEGGYDKLVWTPGAEQAKRYDLSKQINNLEYVPSDNHLKAYDTSGRQVMNQMGVSPEKISDYVGKDVAAKLLNDENAVKFNGEIGFHRLSGLDLQTGGEGMKGYYDKIVPKRLQELIKKLDPEAKIGRETLGVGKYEVVQPNGTVMYAYPNRAYAHRMAERWDGTVRQNQMDLPSLTITPKMRESILKGQTAFKDGGSVVDRALMLISRQA